MNTSVLKLVAGLAWAGLAISGAAPASAYLYTSQTGPYAACSANVEASPPETEGCGYMLPYKQYIKLTSVGCNQGCSSLTGWCHTNFIYGTGRKVTSLQSTCEGYGYLYNLGSCSC
jgi:hypothetical protein